MRASGSISDGIMTELRWYFEPPRQFLQTLAINGVISLLFFLFSYYVGSYNSKLLPVAAATILLWTLADASITNQLVFDRAKVVKEFKEVGTLKRLLIVKNFTIVILSIPLTLLFGLILVAIVGKWSEILYGGVIAFTLIWGWLGISNALSVILPFELLDLRSFLGNRRIWLRYGVLYGLPWVLLPIYAVVMGLPFILLGWTSAGAEHNHRVLALILLLAASALIWLIGLILANRYTLHSESRIKKLIM